MSMEKLTRIEHLVLPCQWEDSAQGAICTLVVLGVNPYGVKKAVGNTVPLRGILKNDPKQNEGAEVVRMGIYPILCGSGGLAIDDPVTSDGSGQGVKATFNATTGNKYIAGYCWQAGASTAYGLVDLSPQWFSQ